MKVLVTILLLASLTCTAQRDMQVKCFTKYGTAFLRHIDGSAIYFSVFSEGKEGVLTVGIVDEIGDGVLPEQFTKHHVISSANYDVDTDTFTFSVIGVDIIAKANDKEIVHIKNIEHLEAGNILLKGNRNYDVINYGTKALPEKKLWSKGKKVDVRDLGDNPFSYLTGDSLTLHYPSGMFSFKQPTRIEGLKNLTLEGSKNTVLYSPKGYPCLSFHFDNCEGLQIKNITFKGNNDKAVLENTTEKTMLYITRCNNAKVDNVKLINPYSAMVVQYSTNVWAKNVSVTSKAGNPSYLQWQIQFADASNSGCIDCSVVSGKLLGGIEAFKSSNISFIRPRLINAVMALNDAGDFLIQDASITIKENTQPENKWFSPGTSLINVNTNAGNNFAHAGGKIINLNMVQEGYINEERDLLRGIIVNAATPNVSIIGGSYKAPKSASKWGNLGLIKEGKNTVVMDFKILELK